MIGVDEVGRGCLAGPLLVVAARARPSLQGLPTGLKDSKLLTRRQRESLFQLLSSNVQYGEGWVSSTEIDKYGLAQAMRLGVRRALADLGAGSDEEVVLDGNVNYLPMKFKKARAIVKADASVPIVSAASIYAKVRRDYYMMELSKRHPKYSFEKHSGYGTALHQDAIKAYGPLRFIHRLSFAPLKTGL